MMLQDAVSALKIETQANANTSFPQFPRFPIEIRRYIWRLAIEALPGRIIPVTEVLTYTNKPGRERSYTYISTRPHPTLSTVSREARITVFENLTPLFQLGTSHTFITMCLERDILLWDACCNGSGGLRELERFAKAVGLEKCQEIRKLGVEDQVNWGEYLMMALVDRNMTILHSMFPKIETLVCIPVTKWKRFGRDAAKFHTGELEFVLRKDSVSTPGKIDMAENALQVWWSRRRTTPSPGLNVEYLQLGIVGGEKQPSWHSVKRHHFWKLMTKEEKEKKEAKAIASAQRLQKWEDRLRGI
jgi:hypothetical protein